MERNPKDRLGSGPGDGEEIQAHPFYRTIDWDKLNRREVTPPFKPDVDNIMETHMFEPEFTGMAPTDTPVPVTQSVLAAEGVFPGFTFKGDGDGGAMGDDFDGFG